MHVLNFLRDPKCESATEVTVTAEYRLLCSGTIYQDYSGDWSKSEIARFLLSEPLNLYAVSRPFSEYPLELSLPLTVARANERDGTFYFAYHPDGEVVSDLAALMCLLCRRLITVSGKVSQSHRGHPYVRYGHQPIPMPIATSMRRVYWPPHPVMMSTGRDGSELIDHNPRPKAVDPWQLTRLLMSLPSISHAENFVASCRLYALALELIHDRADISYQMLISSVETIAGASLQNFEPPDEIKVERKWPVYKLAKKLELSDDIASKLAIEACKDEWWATRKFRKFLIDHVDDSVWLLPDELFHQMDHDIFPKQEHFEKTLATIYNARSQATHSGQAFPASARYTGGPSLSVPAAHQLHATLRR